MYIYLCLYVRMRALPILRSLAIFSIQQQLIYSITECFGHVAFSEKRNANTDQRDKQNDVNGKKEDIETAELSFRNKVLCDPTFKMPCFMANCAGVLHDPEKERESAGNAES